MINPDKGGGVKAFFEFLFDFKSGDSIRSVWEAPAAAVQCARGSRRPARCGALREGAAAPACAGAAAAGAPCARFVGQ